MNDNNIFKEINQKADIIRVANAYGFQLDRQNRCNCFMHNDKEPSLQIHKDTNSWWCYVCGEGYTPIDFVMKSKGISVFEAAKELNDLLGLGVNIKNFNEEKEKLEKTAEYFYRRADNTVTMKVEKWVKPSTGKKEFYPYALIDGKYVKGYVGKLKDEDCVLYNLPEIIKADTIFFTEGEKDADTLLKLGVVGTTTPGGGRGLTGYFKKNPNLFKPIADKKIRIISDNDEVGSEYIKQVLECIKGEVSDIKVFDLCKVMPNLKKKGDITDVAIAVGVEKAKEFLNFLEENTEIWKEEIAEEAEVEEVLETREDIFSIKIFQRLYKYELNSEIDEYLALLNKIKDVCQSKRFTGFDKAYKLYKETQKEAYVYAPNTLVFPGLNENVYTTNRYEMTPDGHIYEIIPDTGKILVCYHPIVPVEKYRNIEDGSEKIKIAYYVDYKWNEIIVDKSIISSTQSIVKLSDVGVSATSENAKALIRYLSEIENLNREKIPVNSSVSRLGWFNDKLIPYDKEYGFDNDKSFPNMNEKFAESGKLEEWIEFFKDRRKHNNISRIAMASAIVSILLKDLKQSGFTLHIWGESEYRKECRLYGSTINIW